LITQPTIMQLAPGFAVVIDDPVPQQQLRQPVPAAHQILPGSFAGADQVTGSFLGQRGDPHRHHLIQAQ